MALCLSTYAQIRKTPSERSEQGRCFSLPAKYERGRVEKTESCSHALMISCAEEVALTITTSEEAFAPPLWCVKQFGADGTRENARLRRFDIDKFGRKAHYWYFQRDLITVYRFQEKRHFNSEPGR